MRKQDMTIQWITMFLNFCEVGRYNLGLGFGSYRLDTGRNVEFAD